MSALAQRIPDYAADGSGRGLPFDLPRLALYDRCLQGSSTVDALIVGFSDDPSMRKPLQRRILQPVGDDFPGFVAVAETLTERAALFAELRKALRLQDESSRKTIQHNHETGELNDIRRAVRRLACSLRKRRPTRGVAQDPPAAIDSVLAHLKTHGRLLCGHDTLLPWRVGSGIRLVHRTNNVLESWFHALEHGERRRSGRKIFTQDFETLSRAAALAANLTHADYVSILCGSLARPL